MATPGLRWTGDLLLPKIRRAVGRATLGLATAVVADGMQNAHTKSTQMRDSVHAAVPDTEGETEATAPEEIMDGLSAAVEVGSWEDYACVEETVRGHAFIAPAVAMNSHTMEPRLRRAFAEEGFTT